MTLSIKTENSEAEKHPYLMECIDLYNKIHNHDVQQNLPFIKHHIMAQILGGHRHMFIPKIGGNIAGKNMNASSLKKTMEYLKAQEGFEVQDGPPENNNMWKVIW